ncbi:MAG: hypothetical protein J7605_02600 [Variovorax sp.]|nr:hypothetical protein [Variovorax sp.]
MSIIRKAILAMRQHLCAHRFSISQIRSASPSGIECTCSRCGKVVRAPYGLALPGQLEQ